MVHLGLRHGNRLTDINIVTKQVKLNKKSGASVGVSRIKNHGARNGQKIK